MYSEEKFGPFVPPRRMTWTSWFPRVFTIDAKPCSVTPMKAWGFEAECIASMATVTLGIRRNAISSCPYSIILEAYLPSVPFLNPMGKETPEANSRCNWLSVVRAPMAPHEITEGNTVQYSSFWTKRYLQSAMYCGDIVSKSSEPTGTPRSVRSQSSWRAVRSPLLILKVPLMSGSFISPFQPTVVRGFWFAKGYL